MINPIHWLSMFTINLPYILTFTHLQISLSVYPSMYPPYIHIYIHTHIHNSNFRQLQRPDGSIHNRRLQAHGSEQDPDGTTLQLQILHLALSLRNHLRVQSLASGALSQHTSLLSHSESGQQWTKQNFGRVQAQRQYRHLEQHQGLFHAIPQ